MARRGENIRKRKDNRWEGRYTLATPEGLKKTRSVYGKTYKEVKSKLECAKQKAREEAQRCLSNSPGGAGPDIPFNQAAEEWLETVAGSRKYSTYVKYSALYQNYIRDPLSNLSIKEITPDSPGEKIFQKGKYYSGSLRRSIYSVVQAVLKHYADEYHAPLVLVRRELPPVEKRKVEIFNTFEQGRLLRVLYDDMDLCKLGILLCLSTGLRLGELCALKWEDIDFHAKVLYVNRTVQRIAVGGQKTRTMLLESAPKTFCSQREIPLSEEILTLLKRFQHSGTYVLNCARPMEPRTYQNRFKKYLQQADVKIKNFHVLRHTFATNCVSHNVDVKSLSEILGHSNVQTTLNRYVHPTIDTKRKYMNEVSAIYGQILGQTG